MKVKSILVKRKQRKQETELNTRACWIKPKIYLHIFPLYKIF